MKETRKQIEAQVRNKLARQYNERLELAYKSEDSLWKVKDFLQKSNLKRFKTL